LSLSFPFQLDLEPIQPVVAQGNITIAAQAETTLNQIAVDDKITPSEQFQKLLEVSFNAFLFIIYTGP
jgi:hypothetical protein